MFASKVAAGRKHGHPYAITLLLVALCAFSQYQGRHVFGQRAPLGLLYLPVMASAILGGWRPAVLASVLSLLLSPLLVAPQFTFIIARPQDAGAILVLLMVCLFTCGMAAVLERSENKARAYLADLQGRENTLRALLGASVHAILGIGHDGRIQFASASVARLFDFAPQELIGQSYEILVVNGLRQLRGGGARQPVPPRRGGAGRRHPGNRMPPQGRQPVPGRSQPGARRRAGRAPGGEPYRRHQRTA
jgi:PAS domain-containing protein